MVLNRPNNFYTILWYFSKISRLIFEYSSENEILVVNDGTTEVEGKFGGCWRALSANNLHP
jgi:hypothetical protein